MKLRLSIETGSLTGQQFELEQGSIVLGRGPDSTIRFDFQKDPGVSTRHAVIQSEDHSFRLIDERSTNGTLINGAVTQNSILQNGDTIRLGPNGPQIRVSIETAFQPERTQEFQVMQPPPLPPYTPQVAASSFSPQQMMQSREGRRSVIGCAVSAVIGGFLMLVVMGLMISQLGFFAAFVGTVVAFAPVPFYLFAVFWIDRFDPEPGWAVAAAFAWGGLVAILVSFVMNTMFGTTMGEIAGAQQGSTLTSIISAPIFEEGSKGVFLLVLLFLMRKEFDGVVDGILYGCVIALGFATFENILYYGGQFLKGGIGALISNVFLRGVLSPFAHALFTSMTGVGCGLARESHNKMIRLIGPPAGYVLAMILHGFWNAIASATGGIGYYIAYIFVWVPLFLIFVGGVIAVVRREQKIIKRMLLPQIDQNVITKEQYDIVTSLRQRTGWVLSSISDVTKMNRRRRFLRYTTKLALGYWHMEQAAKENSSTISTQLLSEYRDEVVRLHPLV
jgi:RsiW-degrading membrane proteinase PrsW (M82 family)